MVTCATQFTATTETTETCFSPTVAHVTPTVAHVTEHVTASMTTPPCAYDVTNTSTVTSRTPLAIGNSTAALNRSVTLTKSPLTSDFTPGSSSPPIVIPPEVLRPEVLRHPSYTHAIIAQFVNNGGVQELPLTQAGLAFSEPSSLAFSEPSSLAFSEPSEVRCGPVRGRQMTKRWRSLDLDKKLDGKEWSDV